jgi:IS5 family transposase
MKISVSDFDVPDEITLCNFRHLVENNKIEMKIEKLIADLLDKNGLIMHSGTIVDATIMSAPKSTRNKYHARDPEMHSTKKGKLLFWCENSNWRRRRHGGMSIRCKCLRYC